MFFPFGFWHFPSYSYDVNFFCVCVICLLRAGWILFKTENLPLFYEFLTDLCYA